MPACFDYNSLGKDVFMFYYALKSVMLYEKRSLFIVNCITRIRVKGAEGHVCVTDPESKC